MTTEYDEMKTMIRKLFRKEVEINFANLSNLFQKKKQQRTLNKNTKKTRDKTFFSIFKNLYFIKFPQSPFFLRENIL